MEGVKNIIFDLGGVLLNIDFSITEKAFKELGVTQFSNMFTQHHSNDLFVQLETGEISPEDFYEAFRRGTGTNLSDESIKKAVYMPHRYFYAFSVRYCPRNRPHGCLSSSVSK